MNIQDKGIIANAVIINLNEAVKAKNKKLCSENLHDQQIPLHGFSMLMDLMSMDDTEFNRIAKLAGV
jgi:hypothetical protein